MSSVGSSSPRNKEVRPRFFDSKVKNKCWAKAQTVAGRHPDRWRKDVAGNIVCKRFCKCQGCLCFEYDHTVPYSKGGESIEENCQILQTRVNRFKADKEVDDSELKGYSCDVKFTGMLSLCYDFFYRKMMIRSSMLFKWLSIEMSFGQETNAGA